MSLQFNPKNMKETIDLLTEMAETKPKSIKFNKRNTVQGNFSSKEPVKTSNNKENIIEIPEKILTARKPSVYSSKNLTALMLKNVKNKIKLVFFQ